MVSPPSRKPGPTRSMVTSLQTRNKRAKVSLPCAHVPQRTPPRHLLLSCELHGSRSGRASDSKHGMCIARKHGLSSLMIRLLLQLPASTTSKDWPATAFFWMPPLHLRPSLLGVVPLWNVYGEYCMFLAPRSLPKCRSKVLLRIVGRKCRQKFARKCRSEVLLISVDQKCCSEVSTSSVDQKCCADVSL